MIKRYLEYMFDITYTVNFNTNCMYNGKFQLNFNDVAEPILNEEVSLNLNKCINIPKNKLQECPWNTYWLNSWSFSYE